MIEIENLLVQRDGRDVLRVDSLCVRRGETLAVVGPNGAGKSTLLLVLARLLKPAQGEIKFNGRSLTAWNEIEYRRKIAFVFQDPLLLDLTVEQNIGLGLTFRGAGKTEIAERVARWSRLLGVNHLLARRARQLSGGEAQRVSLARAFVLEPDLLLMDEPFSALDPQARAQLLRDLAALPSREQRATIFVTHNLEEAAQMARRAAVIADGALKQIGAPQELWKHPASQAARDIYRKARKRGAYLNSPLANAKSDWTS